MMKIKLNKMKHLKIKQIGVGLLELTLALAIIAVILVLATRFYYSAAESRRISDANDQISAIQQALNRWLLSHPDFIDPRTNAAIKNFDPLVQRNYLPVTYLHSNDPKNPWGGDITISASTSNAITVKFDDINGNSADKMAVQNTPLVCSQADVSSVLNQQTYSYFFQITFRTSCPNNNKT